MNNTPESKAFEQFVDCVNAAPEGTYEHAKELREVIGNTFDTMRAKLRAMGYHVDNCDKAWHLEAAIYAFIKRCNPDNPLFPTAEGFGNSMTAYGPETARRVVEQAASNRDALRRMGVAS